MTHLPFRLRALRRQHGLSLEQLAQRTGLTKSYLSKLERAVSAPSISTVVKLAQAYGMGVSQLIGEGELDQDESVCVVRRHDRMPLPSVAGHSTYRYESMAGRRRFRLMDPFIIYPPHDHQQPAPTFPHGGEEFLFVIQGQVQVTIAEHSMTLEVGDSVYFDSELPHSVLSLGDSQAQVLAVTCSDAGPTAGRRSTAQTQAEPTQMSQ